MSKGFWVGDSIAQSIERVGEAYAHGDTIDRLMAQTKRANAAEAELDRMSAVNAANFAEKHALRVALGKLDPKHPLLSNTHLQERIRMAAKQVYALSSSSWDDIANVGRDFKY